MKAFKFWFKSFKHNTFIYLNKMENNNKTLNLKESTKVLVNLKRNLFEYTKNALTIKNNINNIFEIIMEIRDYPLNSTLIGIF